MKKNYPNNVFEEALVLYGITLSEDDYMRVKELSEVDLTETQLKNLEYLVSLNTVEFIKVFNSRFKDKKSYYHITSFTNMSETYASKIVKDILFKLMNHTSIDFIYSDVEKCEKEIKEIFDNNLNSLNLTNSILSALLMAGINNIESLKNLIENKGLNGLCNIKNIGEKSAEKIVETMYKNSYINDNIETLEYKKTTNFNKKTKLSDTNLSLRIRNALSRHGITNIGELITIVNDGSINRIQNIGNISIEEITNLLIENNFIKPKITKYDSYCDFCVYIRSDQIKKSYEENIEKFSIAYLPYPINLIQIIDESLLMKWKEDIIDNVDNKKGYEIITRVEAMIETLTLAEQYAIKYFLSGNMTKSELYTKCNKQMIDFDYAYTMAIRKLRHPYRFRIISGEINTDELFKNNAEKNYFNDIKNIDIAELDVEYINDLYPNLFDKIDKSIPDCTMKQLRDIIEENPKYWYEREEFHELKCDFNFDHKEFIPINIRFIKYLIFTGLVREDKIKDKINLKSN